MTEEQRQEDRRVEDRQGITITETKTPTQTQIRLRLADVPAEKWSQMVTRTILGTVFVALGIALLVFMWVIFDRTEELSEMLLIGGVALFGFGWKTVSGQVVDRQLEQFVKPLKGIVDAFRGKGS